MEAAKEAASRLMAKLRDIALDHKAATAPDAAAAKAPYDADESGPDEPPEHTANVGVSLHKRHAAGTWTIWSNPWFYITHTPPNTDLKVHMYGSFRRYPVNGGMGLQLCSKTMSPHHYGESVLSPDRTLLMLRAWALWRCRLFGWVAARECRQREADSQSMSLMRDLRSWHNGSPSRPLLGHTEVHEFLKSRIPTEVEQVLGQ